MMQAFEHYFTYGVHEGRPIHASEEARLRSAARATGLAAFDEATYLALNPDVAAAVARGETTARGHYEMFGFNEQRMPFFDEQAYLAANPDVAAHVAAGGGSALDHWVQFGQHESRSLAPAAIAASEASGGAFNEQAYLAANSDVAAAIANGTMDSAQGHWERHGQSEGRGFFDEQAYLAANGDVAAAIANGTMDSAYGHYQRHGQAEGRGFFDEGAYLAANPDVARAVANGEGSAAEHWNTFGINEGRSLGVAPTADAPAPAPAPAPTPAPTFEEAYFAANPDVADSGMSAEQHYHAHGAAEGRTW